MESTIWPTWSTEFDPTKDRYVRSFSSTPLISSSTISSMSIRVSSSSAMEPSTAALESWPRSSRRSLSRCYWDRHRPLELPEGLTPNSQHILSRAISPIWTTWMGRTARHLPRIEITKVYQLLNSHRLELDTYLPVIPLTYRFLTTPAANCDGLEGRGLHGEFISCFRL